MEEKNKQSQYSMKYDRSNTQRIYLKFNLKTDADILEKLDSIENKQGYIKDLIRRDIENSKQDNPLSAFLGVGVFYYYIL